MVRALSLYLPWWSIQRIKRKNAAREVDSPRKENRCLLLVRTQANRQTVAKGCPLAVKAGVRPGMTLAHARALLPGNGGEPQMEEHDPQRDRQSLDRLARWATRLAPKVQADGEDGLLMDVTGCGHLYQGEQHLLTRLIEALSQLGFSAAAAIAPTFGAAWAMARYGDPTRRILERLDQIPTALAPLVVSALRIDEETIAALHEVGVHHIGELLHIPRSQLPSRFSEDLMLRIDQALGQAMETIDPVRVPQMVVATRQFEGPVRNLQAIHQAARGLIDAFTQQLLGIESGVLSLRLTLHRYETSAITLSLSVSRATRDGRHLWQLIAPQLEKINLGHGVESLELRALSTARLPHRQRHHPQWMDAQESHEATDQERGRLLDVLMHRLGPDRVLRLEPVESHLPERAAQQVPMDRQSKARVVRTKAHHRPTQLFDEPQRIEVQALTPDGPVSQVMWQGQSLRVESCAGPERLTSEWWRQPTGSRDYFAVRVHSGMHLWLFRDARSSRWFVHGWWA